MSYLGSDMELAVGKEYEKHKFSVPTVAAAPANLPHCPLVTEKVYKAFGHFHLALSPKYAGARADKEGTTNGKKYNYLFKKLPVKKGPGGANAVQQFSMGGKDLSGIPINFTMGLYNKTGEWYPGTQYAMGFPGQAMFYDLLRSFRWHADPAPGARAAATINTELNKRTAFLIIDSCLPAPFS